MEKELSFVFVKEADKKHSVKYACEDGKMSFYIRREALEELGNPQELEVILRVKA